MTYIRTQLFVVIIYCIMLNNHCWKRSQNIMFIKNYSGGSHDRVTYKKVLCWGFIIEQPT